VKIFRFLLYPFGLLYGLVMLLRNKLYDWGILKVTTFDFPVISVGNLSTGGTGKTPHVEYLIRLLNKDFKVATLSRGYKRKTRGFRLADDSSTTDEIGDEALQISKKFRNVVVAVDEDRVRGIREIKKRFPNTDVIILDDAFQHRSVKPGLSVLLTDFHRIYPNNHILPVGNLREFTSGAKRADFIIITKTYNPISPFTVRRLHGLVKPKPNQQLLYSYISYKEPTPVPGTKPHPLPEKAGMMLLFAGIDNIHPLLEHSSRFTNYLEHIKFGDHHRYSEKDLKMIRNKFDDLFTKKKLIITTEKDAARLAYPELPSILADLPIFYVPIEIKIHNEYRKAFNDQIRNYVRENSGNKKVHT
jgi:tetraacyldisaccharide 4'-kinase